MVHITFKDDDAILKFPKQLVSSGYVQEFLEKLRLEAIVEKSQLTEEDEILQLLYGLLKKIKIFDEESVTDDSLQRAHDLCKDVDEKDM